ncbi:hypothetical protein Ancab_011039 [Ancistrocladus abbreviatus]
MEPNQQIRIKTKQHEEKEEEAGYGGREMLEPVSPTGQYFNSSVLSICILGILESQVPLDESPAIPLLRDVFLPINPRFSSIMVVANWAMQVVDKTGVKQWKRVVVKLEDHVNVPIFPAGLSPESYDSCFDGYLTKIAMDPLPQDRPLWEIHLFKYPTSSAAGHLIFKLHHALGDGYSLMGALLSCLKRADNPALPLTFPSFQQKSNPKGSILSSVTKTVTAICNTPFDFGWSLLKSSLVQDETTPIRSADEGVQFHPVKISTLTFSLDQIKQIKDKLQVTINDVITGIIFSGARLYMQGKGTKSPNPKSTALVLLNTRNIDGYKSLEEMVASGTETSWGNRFTFVHVSVPELKADNWNPLEFVFNAQKIIKRKRNSLAVHFNGHILETLRKYRGPEVAARYIHSTLKNSTMTISNMTGPVEQMALADHPVKGFYFMVVGVPQSLTITILSYMQKLRIAVGAEKGFIDLQKFISCLETAFELILEAANKSGP